MITPSKSKIYSIRSNEERVLKVPKFKHDTFGKRAFAVYGPPRDGPLAWNCLPKEIGLCDEIEAFKRNLKTHLFIKFVNESTLAIRFWWIIEKRPRMLSAQFVALYKPCKPKPKPIDTGNGFSFLQRQRLSKSMMISCEWDSNEQTSIRFHLSLNILHIMKLIWKCRPYIKYYI